MEVALPEGSTARSRALLGVAAELAERWPGGAAIGVAGSVARGTADAASDVELSFWLDAPVSEALVDGWLVEVGAEDVATPPFSSGWPVFRQLRWRGAWFDAGWHTAEEQQRELDRALAGRDLSPNGVVTPGIVASLAPLRDDARVIARWKAQVAVFPEPLANLLMEKAIVLWRMPHWVESRWTLARRGQRMALATLLRMDADGLLRVVFAHNRAWPQDWKWLHAACAGLSVAPPDLAARVDGLFAEPDAMAAVCECYRLVAEVLALLPEREDAREASRIVRASLSAHEG